MTLRAVHYLNQFFAGIGGEEAAGRPPARRDGPVGPGRRLQSLLGNAVEIITTVHCGDDHAAAHPEAAAAILELAGEADLLIAGPAFTSGRYGIACARVAASAAAAGRGAVACMHDDNPGVAEAGTATVVLSGDTARTMEESLRRLAHAVRKLAAGEALGAGDHVLAPVVRRNRLADRCAAERAVDLLLARLGGDREATEIPVTGFGSVRPAAPVADPGSVAVALLTEGALVPQGNPDRLESARARSWRRYSLAGRDRLSAGEFESVHGGFSTVLANADPHRILPLDAARELEAEGRIGRLHDEYLVTAGNGTHVGAAAAFGVEWSAELRRAGVQAAILTAT
jgi:glycine reductase complex component B subunit gamma